jgi:hypothetical protein
MTPLQAAKAHCANYQPDGSCLGIYYNADLSVDWSRYRPLPKCAIALGQACPYFEQIVLPQASGAVAEEYRTSLPPEVGTEIRPQKVIARHCLDCRKREVAPRKKYCPACARVRQRDSARRTMRAKRSLDVNKLANSPIGAEALTKAETQVGYPYPKTPILESSFPTRQETPTRIAS